MSKQAKARGASAKPFASIASVYLRIRAVAQSCAGGRTAKAAGSLTEDTIGLGRLGRSRAEMVDSRTRPSALSQLLDYGCELQARCGSTQSREMAAQCSTCNDHGGEPTRSRQSQKLDGKQPMNGDEKGRNGKFPWAVGQIDTACNFRSRGSSMSPAATPSSLLLFFILSTPSS